MDTKIQFPKPNIILIDLISEVEERLTSSGFNVTTGRFGNPYIIEKKDKYDFIHANFSLPNLREQEIIIIDLETKSILDRVPSRKVTRDGDTDIRVRLLDGIVDPRPLTMHLNSSEFDTIWKHKGIFIVFADSSIHQEYQISKKEGYGWYNQKELKINLLSFLPFLNDNFVYLISNEGFEFKLSEKEKKWSLLLSKYLKDSKYNVVLTYEPWMRDYIKPILLNKYNEIVSSLIITHDKSLLIILPQIDRKSDLINELLTSLLPEAFPDLFPYYEGKIWVKSSIYDFESVVKLKNERENIILEKDTLIRAIEQNILEEKNKYEYLYKILTETGDDLVQAIEDVLALLGFNDVKNIDKELAEINSNLPKQEDLQILDKSPSILAEVKGIISLPRENDMFQIVKYISRRMKEWKRTDIKGLVIVNHQKNLPPLRRDINPFTDQQTKDGKYNNFGLISTWNLFLLIKGMLKYNWEKELIKSKLYNSGIIDKVPLHYNCIGHIENYWEHQNVVGIRLEKDNIKKNDTISFITENDYCEQKVESLQVDKNNREEAIKGESVGIKTTYTKEILKKGMSVYKVNS